VALDGFILRRRSLPAFALFQFEALREHRNPPPDGVGARLFELGLEALQLDFFNHCRDLRLLCNEVDLFYRSLNNRVDFLGKTTPSLIGPPLAQKHRDTLRVVVGVDPTVDCSWMPVEDPGDLLHMGTRSLGLVHFEERFKD
jgi:hypothetical protein